ncbi:MAG TPA: HDIG domain-containing protein [Kofleriaceae bacterium]|nr:HDIG domain-containing protein [Kofleriaceae bacterium]
MIRSRARANVLVTLVLSAAFAALATPIVLLDSWLQASYEIEAGEPSPITVRIPQFTGFGAEGAPDRLEGGQVVVARGQMVDESAELAVRRIRADRPSGRTAFLAFFAALFLLALLYTNHLRRSHTGRLVRTQVVTLGLLVLVAAGVQMALLFTPMSVLVVPVAGIALIAVLAVDLSVGLATGLAVSMLLAFLVPFDAGTVAVLTVQSFASTLAIAGRKNRTLNILAAGTIGGLAAATVYFVFYYLGTHATPMHELGDPMRSAWMASFAGGLLSGVMAVSLQPMYQLLLGEITRNRLVELEDLSNPLLKQIAEKAPGTWQHSLAMANMAEIAANSIGASGRLVRVGAYYHDLGKSLQSTYFIENLRGGEQSPHDRLPPDVSCDAIFAHVTEGVRIARKEGLPERIIDFMHMHHGDGLLEYFWAKCQEQGNPNNLTQDDFRYPGVKPQTRETAILAICDAVEAASRTLKNPDEYAIRNLVQRIVYGKLHLGQLDESGLAVAELRRIANSLEETIKHAFHGRIEYPWQRKERDEAAAESTTRPERPRAPSELAVQAAAPSHRMSATQRIIDEPRLDSLDVPRPYWGSRPPTATPATPIESAATERVSGETPVPTPTDAAAPSPAHTEHAAVDRAQTPVPEEATDPAPTDTSNEHETVLLLRKKPADDDPDADTDADADLDTGNDAHEAVTVIRQSPVSDVHEAVTAVRPSPLAHPDARPERAATTRASEPAPEPSVLASEPHAASTSDETASAQAQHAADAELEARPTNELPIPRPELDAPEPPEPAPAAASEELAVWNDALERAAEPVDPAGGRRQPPPPPGSRVRHGRSTIPLMKSDPIAEEDLPASSDQRPGNGDSAPANRDDKPRARTRADTDDEEKLTPGMMVLGPPPATHKSKNRSGDS